MVSTKKLGGGLFIKRGAKIDNNKMKTFQLSNPIAVNSVGELVNKFADIFSYVVILFAVLAIVYVGFRFVIAQGKPDELNTLKTWLGWIVVGVAIVIGARMIIRIVINTLSATKTVDQGVIDSANRALDRK